MTQTVTVVTSKKRPALRDAPFLRYTHIPYVSIYLPIACLFDGTKHRDLPSLGVQISTWFHHLSTDSPNADIEDSPTFSSTSRCPHLRLEAQIEAPIHLIHHQHRHPLHITCLALNEIYPPPRGRDRHLDAPFQLQHLSMLLQASEGCAAPQLVRLCKPALSKVIHRMFTLDVYVGLSFTK
jgi:hypothetical protein